MGAMTDRLDAGTATAWIDQTDYAAKLVNKNRVPWLDVGEFVALQRRAQGLVSSDVVALPVGEVCAAWVGHHLELNNAMGAKARTVFPLKTLLADADLRAHLVELAAALRASAGNALFALAVPSPRAWVGIAYAQAHPGIAVDVGEDETDSAAVYVADFLRAFATSAVDVLLLHEASSEVAIGAAHVQLYQPVFNVAANYRWDCGLMVIGAIDAAAAKLLDFTLSGRASAGKRHGTVLADAYWNGKSAAPAATLRYGRIPASAQPEAVLARAGALH